MNHGRVSVATVPDPHRVAAAVRTVAADAAPAARAEAGVVGIAIDVLRATSTLTVAFASGAAGVVPLTEPGEARTMRDARSDVLACGERGGRIVPGFDLGNSPFEYTRDRVAGRTLAFASTNGSFAMLDVSACGRRWLGAFVNASAVVAAIEGEADVRIVCAGKEGRAAEEDSACAGWIVARLMARGFAADAAGRALAADAPADEVEIRERVLRSEHGLVLAALGAEYARDVEFCAGLDRVGRVYGW